VMFSFGFVLISYVLVLLVGLPIHWILSKFKAQHWSLYLAAGVAIALVYEYVSNYKLSPPYQETGYMVSSACALVVSYSFWYLAVKSHNKGLKVLDGTERRPLA